MLLSALLVAFEQCALLCELEQFSVNYYYYAFIHRVGAVSCAFVRPSVCPFVRCVHSE